MGYYQRVRGHVLPVRAHWELPSSNVGGGFPAEYFALRVETTLWCSTPPPLPPPQIWHTFFNAKCQRSLKRRRGGRRGGKRVVRRLLLKISLVKFKVSKACRSDSGGLQGVKEAEWEGLKGKEGCVREKQQNTESEQIAQAELAREAQYVLEGFANRSLFFIARMKAAENVKPACSFA